MKRANLIGLLGIIILVIIFGKLLSLQPKTAILSPSGEPPIINKEYIVITDSEIIPKVKPEETVSVIEFFSYHCSVCYEIEPARRAWLKLHPNVRFEQVPIGDDSAHSNAIVRLHYLAHQLKKDMTATIFEWLSERKDIQNPAVVRESLLNLGISAMDYEQTMLWQTGVDTQVIRGKNLEKLYGIEETPVFIVGGRYKTSLAMTNGDLLRFFEVMDALIEKVRQGKN